MVRDLRRAGPFSRRDNKVLYSYLAWRLNFKHAGAIPCPPCCRILLICYRGFTCTLGRDMGAMRLGASSSKFVLGF